MKLPILLFVISALQENISPGAAQTINVKAKIPFGAAKISVDFENPTPTSTNYVSIYKKKNVGQSNSGDLWSSMCGDQDSWNTADCPSQTSGTVDLTLVDPDHENRAQFPLNPGKYSACLMDDTPAAYTAVVCKDFRIKGLPKKIVNRSSVSAGKSSYAVGEAIDVSFTAGKAIMNTWIGIYSADVITDTMKKLPGEPVEWLYSACNNRSGDQSETNNCSKKKKSGTVNFDGVDHDGEYKVCISFMNNLPYNRFKCSDDTFVVGDGTSGGNASISVSKARVNFGDDFSVSFTNTDPTLTNWVGIYKKSEQSPVMSGSGELWASMCGDQDSWNDPILCPAQSSGSITFSLLDPDTENDSQYPLPPGRYIACVMDDIPADYTVKACADFRVKGLPAIAITDSTVTATQSSFAVDEPITADFSAAVVIRNTWIGVYLSSAITSDLDALPGEPLMWVYSGCNNQDGDQSTTNNCSVEKATGTIQIDSTSTDRSIASWPLPAETYVFCMSFYNNSPYKKFVCSSDFTIA